MLTLETNELIIILASILAVILINVTIIIFARRKPKMTTPVIDFQELLEGLGGSSNLIDISMEHQRLKVKVRDVKLVNQTTLKKLEIPTFLKGKELTLLIKNHTKDVLSYLSERQKEVN